MSKALIAMSGGVDSSVAALLTKQSGYECVGATMRLFDNSDIGLTREHTCCSLDDVEDARSVAFSLGIPYYVFNFSDRFKKDVIDRFIYAYEHGWTPNPCIDCNRFLKFDKFYTRAMEIGCDYVVTGHYAVIEKPNADCDRYTLKRPTDRLKDQTYVLYSMTQEQLAHTLFPLGRTDKQETRKIAEQNGFINAAKHDSQDICFVQNGSYADFIEEYTGKHYPPGNFVDKSGRILGRHNGIIRYTVGQRKGLGISSERPLYVCSVDPVRNEVCLGGNEDLFTDTVYAEDVNFISIPKLDGHIRVTAAVRYHGRELPADLYPTEKGIKLVFDSPQRAVTAGQAVVMYDGDTVVGGGTIVHTENSYIKTDNTQ